MDWKGIIGAIAKAIKDVRAGKPAKPVSPMSSEEMIAKLKALLVYAPEVINLLEKYEVGLDDLLDFLKKNKIYWAEDLEVFLHSLPGDIEEVEKWLPTIQYWLNAFKPAPGRFTGIS